MTSKYFHRDPDHIFETIHQYDPSLDRSIDTWSLKSLPERPLWSYQQGMFSWEECEKVIVLGERLSPQKATLMGERYDDSIRKSFTSWISPTSASRWIFERITHWAVDHNNKYFQYDLDHIERIQFTKYEASEQGFYGVHIDSYNNPGTINRKLSLSVQLTCEDEYEGGEVILKPTGKDIVMQKQCGMGVFFPSHVAHEVKPVTKGTRYSLVVWFLGNNIR